MMAHALLNNVVRTLKRKEVKTMKIATSFLAGLVLMGSVGVTGAKAADGVLLKEQDVAGSYCHMQFPAIEESTLYTDNPVLKSADSGDIIDFYGSCDENPLGKDQVIAQRSERENSPDRNRRFGSGL
jgi:hypothetical protein